MTYQPYLNIILANDRTRATAALNALVDLDEGTEVVNASEHKGFRQTLNYALERAWDAARAKHAPYSDAVRALYFDIDINGVTLSNAMVKRARKHTGAECAGMLASFELFVTAAKPVAELVKGTKGKITKGRKPSKNPARSGPKCPRTCGYCWRTIGQLESGFIAQHGYRVHEYYSRVGHCPGDAYRPLEESPDGLAQRVKDLNAMVSNLTTELAAVGTIKSFTVRGEKIDRSSPRWDYTYHAHVVNIENTLKYASADAEQSAKFLAAWLPGRGLPKL